MFCSIVGHASFQTAPRIGPSTMERSNALPFFGALTSWETSPYKSVSLERISLGLPHEVEFTLATEDPMALALFIQIRLFFLATRDRLAAPLRDRRRRLKLDGVPGRR